MKLIAAAAAVVAMTAGCETMVQRVDCASGQYYGVTDYEVFPQTPRVDCAFGQSVDMAVARQTIDKNAGAKNAARQVGGMDGVAAKAAIDGYKKSFTNPEPPPSAMIQGVGTGSSPTQ